MALKKLLAVDLAMLKQMGKLCEQRDRAMIGMMMIFYAIGIFFFFCLSQHVDMGSFTFEDYGEWHARFIWGCFHGFSTCQQALVMHLYGVSTDDYG